MWAPRASRPTCSLRRPRSAKPKERQDKLTHGEYDQASWGTRTWKTWVVHKISVAAHRSMAGEIARALNLGVGCDYRDARDAA